MKLGIKPGHHTFDVPGVDTVAEFPYSAGKNSPHDGRNSLGSTISPAIALAATVAGLPKNILASRWPMRPGKFGLPDEMQTSPVASEGRVQMPHSEAVSSAFDCSKICRSPSSRA